MTRSRYLVLCALVFAGAFAGGYRANRESPIVHAQNLILPTDIRARSFTLLDAQGNAQATFRPSGTGRSGTGFERWRGGKLVSKSERPEALRSAMLEAA